MSVDALRWMTFKELRAAADKPHLKPYRELRERLQQEIQERQKDLDILNSPTQLRARADKLEQELQERHRRQQELRAREAAQDQLWKRAARERAELPFTVLGLSPSASKAEIKQRYRALVKQHHPDLGGNPARLREIVTAYNVLMGEVL
jgi:DnaJ-domain-containing protein 1